MKEELLHFIWRFQLFEKRDFKTCEGEIIEVIYPGIQNYDSGPDFLNAKIKIGDKVWAGHVELHLNTDDWFKHGHQKDPAYNNVILHVVYDDVAMVKKPDIPLVSLKYRISRNIIDNYTKMINQATWVACEDSLQLIDSLTWTTWLQRLIAERVEYKNSIIKDLLIKTNNDWHESFYISIARSFGYRVNADAFEKLAIITPQKLIAKHKNSLFQIEALLFGQAGLLDGIFKDDYPLKLQKEYSFLCDKYNLQNMDASEWKFARMWPVSFPTIRIAQFAQLLYKSSSLFNKILEIDRVANIVKCLETEASSYWFQHYIFDNQTITKSRKKLGKSTVNRIIINSVIPILFAFGKEKDKNHLTALALELFEVISPEKNSIIDQWQSRGIFAKNAGETQALLHLKNEYCNKKRCLICAIGTAVLRKNR